MLKLLFQNISTASGLLDCGHFNFERVKYVQKNDFIVHIGSAVGNIFFPSGYQVIELKWYGQCDARQYGG